MAVGQWFNVKRVWTMTPLENLESVRAAVEDLVSMEFIAIPNYAARFDEATFTTDWLWRIEQFINKGARVIKFWAAPRGLDFTDALRLDSPVRIEAMDLARDAGLAFMTHIADPDTWFATHYADAAKYGSKAQQYEPLERMLEKYHDVCWLAAHMGGHPEDLDHLQRLLDTYPHLYLDTSATKWMIRELSKHPAEFRAFCERNPGRIMFGSDLVATPEQLDPEWYASRYWSLKAMLETDIDTPSPIVDPDLSMIDPALPATSTAHLRGASLEPATLQSVYHDAEVGFWQHHARLRRGNVSPLV